MAYTAKENDFILDYLFSFQDADEMAENDKWSKDNFSVEHNWHDSILDGTHSDITATSIDIGTTIKFTSRVLTVDTGGGFNIDLGTAPGDDFTIDSIAFIVKGDTGNIGVALTPPATGSQWRSINIGGNSVWMADADKGANKNMYLMQNAYREAGGYKYISSDEASVYQMGSGKHFFYTIPSGTAGEAMSLGTATMIIDNSGKVGIGTSGPDRKLDILDVTDPQLRLTHTDGVDYADFQVDTDGNLTITPSGTKVIIAKILEMGGNIVSDTDSTDDLGTTGARWANLFVDDITVTASITTGGNIVSDTDSTDDLGTTGVRWANLFVDDITLTNDLLMGATGKISTGGETAPDVDNGGMTLKLATTLRDVMSFKGASIVHPFTIQTEEDTAALFSHLSAINGGFVLDGYSAVNAGVSVAANSGTEDTSDTTNSVGGVTLTARLSNGGTGFTTYGNAGNIFAIQNSTITRLVLKGDGTLHIGNTTLVTLADDEDDIQMVRDLQHVVTKSYKHKVSKEGFQRLVNFGALSSTGDFQSVQGCNAVTFGAIGQMWNMIRHLGKELGLDEVKLKQLAKQYS